MTTAIRTGTKTKPRGYVEIVRKERAKGQSGYIIEWHPANDREFDDVLDAFKALVPSSKREWRPEDKEWWVAKDADLSPVFVNWKEMQESYESRPRLPGF